MFSLLTFVQILAHTFCECEQSGPSIIKQSSVSFLLNNMSWGSDGPANLKGIEDHTSRLVKSQTKEFLKLHTFNPRT